MIIMDEPIFITFMRHGRSRADDEGVIEGRYDSPLTDAGIRQVTQRANLWQAEQVHFDRIVCSTLQRVQTSARIVGEILNAPVEPDPDWMEFNNGPLAGLTFAEAEKRYPTPAFRNPYEPFWESGESEWEIHRRAARAIENLVRRAAGSTLVIAHGGILNVALRCIVGAPIPVNGVGVWFYFGDTGYVRTSYRPDRHQWLIRELNPGFAET